MSATNGREEKLVPLAKVQNDFTTKNMKNTKESEDEALGPDLRLDGIKIY